MKVNPGWLVGLSYSGSPVFKWLSNELLLTTQRVILIAHLRMTKCLYFVIFEAAGWGRHFFVAASSAQCYLLGVVVLGHAGLKRFLSGNVLLLPYAMPPKLDWQCLADLQTSFRWPHTRPIHGLFRPSWAKWCSLGKALKARAPFGLRATKATSSTDTVFCGFSRSVNFKSKFSCSYFLQKNRKKLFFEFRPSL